MKINVKDNILTTVFLHLNPHGCSVGISENSTLILCMQYPWPQNWTNWKNWNHYTINRNTVPVSEAVEVLSSIGWADSGSSAPWSWDSEACQESRLWAQALLLKLAGADSHSSMSLARTGYYSGGRFTCTKAKRDRSELDNNIQDPISPEGLVAGPKKSAVSVLCHMKQTFKSLPLLNQAT